MSSICDRICQDLLSNKHWHSADRLHLSSAGEVVAAREFPSSPLVVFVPLSGMLKVAEMGSALREVKQLALQLAAGEVELERSEPSPEPEKEVKAEEEEVIHDPDGGRFQIETSFSRDKCLRLYRELCTANERCRAEREEEERKRARVEEDRLGLITISPPPPPPHETEDTPFNPIVDLYTSVMFAFHDGGVISYFQAASGLVPPVHCPDDSDDEKPPDVVRKEMKKAKQRESNPTSGT